MISDTKRNALRGLAACLALVSAAFLASCTESATEQVVVYCAWDQHHSQPILQDFEKETGIKVVWEFDVEATKTSMLRDKIIGQKDNPRCDLFWNNEPGQTYLLKREGILRRIPDEVWNSDYITSIPAKYKDADKDRMFVGFAARARVIIWNTNRMKGKAPPTSIRDFVDPKYKGQSAIADPKNGTTATHLAALFVNWGEESTEEFIKKMKANHVAVENGNAVVAEKVAGGEYMFGLTDSDDANLQRSLGKPVSWAYLDQKGEGTLVMPNTAMLIKGSRNQKNAEKLLRWLISRKNEERLAKSKAIQMPLGKGAVGPEPSKGKGVDPMKPLSEIRVLEVNYSKVAPFIITRCQKIGEELR